MLTRTARAALAVAAALLIAVLWVPAAGAATSPALSLDQSAGNTAGSTTNLGMNLTFSNTGSDSPDQLTINLPPGLLANADIDNGACLTTADLSDTSCQVGTGTVTADALDLVPLTVPVTFDLVPPPAPGDLAGLAVNDNGTQIGSTADVKVRPSGSAGGVGITIDFVLPNSLDGVPIQLANIDSTFDGLRYPTTCPSTPADVTVGVNSYQVSSVKTVSAPLSVTGCSSLPYAPKFAATVTKDSADRQVKLTTTVTQAANESPTGSLTLGFTGNALAVNLGSIKALCTNLASGSCSPVGTATADSPLYPKPLTANAYLTGNVNGPTLTLAFPAPFPLTLVGNVDLGNLTTTFSGLPDIPLTSLALTLNGGPEALFNTNCRPYNGGLSATLVDQNGDKTVKAADSYTIVGCAAWVGASAAKGSSGSGSSSANSAGVKLTSVHVSGSKSGHPTMRFVVSSKRGRKLVRFTIAPPKGMHFIAGRSLIKDIKVSGGKLKSAKLVHGKLVITLRKPVERVRVTIIRALTRVER
jgi:hypothetical protein